MQIEGTMYFNLQYRLRQKLSMAFCVVLLLPGYILLITGENERGIARKSYPLDQLIAAGL